MTTPCLLQRWAEMHQHRPRCLEGRNMTEAQVYRAPLTDAFSLLSLKNVDQCTQKARSSSPTAHPVKRSITGLRELRSSRGRLPDTCAVHSAGPPRLASAPARRQRAHRLDVLFCRTLPPGFPSWGGSPQAGETSGCCLTSPAACAIRRCDKRQPRDCPARSRASFKRHWV